MTDEAVLKLWPSYLSLTIHSRPKSGKKQPRNRKNKDG